MTIAVRIVATCESSKAISTEPEFQKIVSVLRVSKSVHLSNFSVQFFDDVFHYVGTFRQVGVKEMGCQ